MRNPTGEISQREREDPLGRPPCITASRCFAPARGQEGIAPRSFGRDCSYGPGFLVPQRLGGLDGFSCCSHLANRPLADISRVHLLFGNFFFSGVVSFRSRGTISLSTHFLVGSLKSGAFSFWLSPARTLDVPTPGWKPLYTQPALSHLPMGTTTISRPTSHTGRWAAMSAPKWCTIRRRRQVRTLGESPFNAIITPLV